MQTINIDRFRGLSNIDINLGERITIISGKNGTSKSTILGIVAQVFSFRTDYSEDIVERDNLRQYKSLFDKSFESPFSDHFRFSSEFDVKGSMEVRLSIFDALEDKLKENLSLTLNESKDRSKARPILRGNSDRNITHPVIYLSLKRLLPISSREKYIEQNVQYIKDNLSYVTRLSNQILLQHKITNITPTTGTLPSLAIHGENYDKEAISAGEDNVGQIIQAILSFKKLKEEFSNYKGGILLIDEADAGLFPAAQKELIKILAQLAKELNLQIIMTSHSPIMVQEVFDLQQKDSRNYKTIYLTDTYGKLQVLEDISWTDIDADLNVETIDVGNEVQLPKVNIYFEDKEASDFFNALVTNRKLRKPSLLLSDITLGCKQYLTLHDRNIPEFSKESIIILDGDQQFAKGKYKNIILLPTQVPPDQLVFEFLYNLPSDDDFWRNSNRFTKSVFLRIANDIIGLLEIKGNEIINISKLVDIYRSSNANKAGIVREKFKEFYKNEQLQRLIKGPVKSNPFRLWCENNKETVREFNLQYEKALKSILINIKKAPKSLIEEFYKTS
ncbi:ATP-binding protein [Lysinibacillus varians]|uniref:ATP-binding protein n=1 Tax=Lysinibacillus varians TaxID=1145276 RepID=A0ABY2TGW9_9BACI|nr:ATP-binding protein [Lysinibacillus varians]